MEEKIQKLVDQIYNDGMERASRDAESLLSDAKSDAERMIAEAERKAERIVQEAVERAAEERRRTEAELELAAGQALTRLRQRVQELAAGRVLEDAAGKAMLDPAFLQELILEIARAWFADPEREAELEVMLPAALKDRLEKETSAALTGALAGLEIEFDGNLKAGFRIARKGDVFMVDFSDEALIEFFRPYLKKKTAELFPR